MLAETAGWPLLAEPTSGSRTGDIAIRTYRLLLADDDLAARIEQVVVFGHPTLSRPVARLLGRDDVELYAVRGPSGWSDVGHHVHFVVDRVELEGVAPGWFASEKVPEAEPEADPWLQEWRDRDAAVSRDLDALLAARGALTPHQVAGAVSAALPAGRAALRRRVQPGARPRPDGGALPRRRPPDGRRQPRPGRHRRVGLHGGRAPRWAARTAPAPSRCSATSPSCTTPTGSCSAPTRSAPT